MAIQGNETGCASASAHHGFMFSPGRVRDVNVPLTATKWEFGPQIANQVPEVTSQNLYFAEEGGPPNPDPDGFIPYFDGTIATIADQEDLNIPSDACDYLITYRPGWRKLPYKTVFPGAGFPGANKLHIHVANWGTDNGFILRWNYLLPPGKYSSVITPFNQLAGVQFPQNVVFALQIVSRDFKQIIDITPPGLDFTPTPNAPGKLFTFDSNALFDRGAGAGIGFWIQITFAAVADPGISGLVYDQSLPHGSIYDANAIYGATWTGATA